MSAFSLTLASLKQRVKNLNAAIERAATENNISSSHLAEFERQNTLVGSALNWYSEARIIQAETKVLCADLEIKTRKEEIKKYKQRIKSEHAKLRKLHRSFEETRDLAGGGLLSDFTSRASQEQNATNTKVSKPATPSPKRTRVASPQQTTQRTANNSPQQPLPIINKQKDSAQSTTAIWPQSSASLETPASNLTNMRQIDFEKSQQWARIDQSTLSRPLKNKTTEPKSTKVVGTIRSNQTSAEPHHSTMRQAMASHSSTTQADITWLTTSKQNTTEEIIGIVSSLGHQTTEDPNYVSAIPVNAKKKARIAPYTLPKRPGPVTPSVKRVGIPLGKSTVDVTEAPAPRHFDFSQMPTFVINGDISLNTKKIEAPIEQKSTVSNTPERVQLSAVSKPRIAPFLVEDDTTLSLATLKNTLPVSIPLTSGMTLPCAVQNKINLSNTLRIEKRFPTTEKRVVPFSPCMESDTERSLQLEKMRVDESKKTPTARLKKRCLSLIKPKDAVAKITDTQLNSPLNKIDKAKTPERKGHLTTLKDVAGTSEVTKETQKRKAKDLLLAPEAKKTKAVDSEVLPGMSQVQDKDVPKRGKKSARSLFQEPDTFYYCSQNKLEKSSAKNSSTVKSSKISKAPEASGDSPYAIMWSEMVTNVDSLFKED